MNGYDISQNQLLEMRIEELFTLDSQSRMLTINEPWDKTKPAPRLYLGKTLDGSVIYRLRYDVPPETIKELEEYLITEPPMNKDNEIKYINEYLKILGSNNYSEGIWYYYKNAIESTENNCRKITTGNIKDFRLNGFEWLHDEINYCQHCYGIMEDDKIVSLCRSVRISEKAHEAGIETMKEYRGQGLAKIALMNWANEVRNKGCIAFYSTSKENRSSQRVAEKALLSKLGIEIGIN
jgi:RimJ/RimL family protein N-acetyltransferase